MHDGNGQVILTLEGVRKLEEELEYLKSVKRIEVADRIKQAISFGDLSENAEYDEAKNEQAFMEGRIHNIETALRNATIVDESSIPTDVVGVGSLVRVLALEDDEEEEYSIVGTNEVDASKGKISNESPIGVALMGHVVGDTVKVEAPGGAFEMRILSISR